MTNENIPETTMGMAPTDKTNEIIESDFVPIITEPVNRAEVQNLSNILNMFEEVESKAPEFKPVQRQHNTHTIPTQQSRDGYYTFQLEGIIIFESPSEEVFNTIVEYIQNNGMDETVLLAMSKSYRLDYLMDEVTAAKKNYTKYQITNDNALMAIEKKRYNECKANAKVIAEELKKLKDIL